MFATVDRYLKRALLVGFALVGLAVMANHHNHPCSDTQVGAAGMCVTVSTGGAR